MTRTQMEREDPTFLDFDVGQNIRRELELWCVTDQTGVAVDHHQAGILGSTHQHQELAARLADRKAILERDHARIVGRPRERRTCYEQGDTKREAGGERARLRQH